jgi:hypothetical protein
MSVSGISNIGSVDISAPSVQDTVRKFRQEFQQLGQDLQSGNLSAAQADFATLQQIRNPNASTSSTTGKHPIADGFNQLSQDLQSGNVSAAQQDYTNIQQAYQNLAAHRHHHHGGGEGGANGIGQLLSQLSQALQSGDPSAAQQAYSTLQQDLQLFAQKNGLSAQTPSPSSSNSVSVSA